jgi:hypothetical protein
MKTFRDLFIWQKAMSLVTYTYQIKLSQFQVLHVVESQHENDYTEYYYVPT